MTSAVFSCFCHYLNKKMQQQKRKIALVVDNCTAHAQPQNLQNVKLIFLPPNTTAKTQPMDAGVIRCLKSYYRREMALKRLLAFEQKKTFDEQYL